MMQLERPVPVTEDIPRWQFHYSKGFQIISCVRDNRWIETPMGSGKDTRAATRGRALKCTYMTDVTLGRDPGRRSLPFLYSMHLIDMRRI